MKNLSILLSVFLTQAVSAQNATSLELGLVNAFPPQENDYILSHSSSLSALKSNELHGELKFQFTELSEMGARHTQEGREQPIQAGDFMCQLRAYRLNGNDMPQLIREPIEFTSRSLQLKRIREYLGIGKPSPSVQNVRIYSFAPDNRTDRQVDIVCKKEMDTFETRQCYTQSLKSPTLIEAKQLIRSAKFVAAQQRPNQRGRNKTNQDELLYQSAYRKASENRRSSKFDDCIQSLLKESTLVSQFKTTNTLETLNNTMNTFFHGVKLNSGNIRSFQELNPEQNRRQQGFEQTIGNQSVELAPSSGLD